MSVTKYDSKNVSITFDNVFITGLADGTAVEGEKNEDNASHAVGIHGDVVISETNDPTGVVTITVQQTSPSVAYLTRCANAGTLAPLWCISNNVPKEKFGGNYARVLKPANKSFSNESETREFEIAVYDYTVE
ncbi:phage structural protein [Mycobacteroides abscessus]|uniref:phage structural protein n=1 Tax=Mycobacteroides abscessus TaxID=36809 RepID=UPI000C25B9BD